MSRNTSLLLKYLFKQTWPMLVGLFSIMGSQLVDSIFIAKLGAEPLAVVAFSIAIFQVIVGVQVGLGIAATATISTALGENKVHYARYLGSLIVFIGTVIVTLLCLALWLFQQPIILALGATPSLFNLTELYWLPWLISCWLGALLYFGYSICRAHNETLLPGRIMVLTSVLNIALDPLFMFTFDMGLAGAAWASCVAFAIGLVVVFYTLIKRELVTFDVLKNRTEQAIKAIAKMMAPALLSQFIPPISAMIVTALIAAYGGFAVAAWGLANRIEYIAIILILALTMALPPIVGNLKGRGELRQILSVVKLACGFVIGIQILLAVIMLGVANPLANALSNNSEIVANLTDYFAFVPLSYAALGVCMITVSVCNALGFATTALFISILRLFLCYLPLLWLGSYFYGLTGLFIGMACGNTLSGIVGWQLFKQQYKRLTTHVSVRSITV